MKNEMIVLASTLSTELKDLPKRIPKDSARYHFFLYKHSHEGDYLESIGMPQLSSGVHQKPLGGLVILFICDFFLICGQELGATVRHPPLF